MKVRLGYVSISNTINLTTSKNITYKRYKDNNNDYNLIDTAIKSNLINLIEVLKYNEKNNIHFYRLSSNIIPLVTHPNIIVNYTNNYNEYYKIINNLINQKNMRLDMHASNYIVLNSINTQVINSSIESLKYHYKLQKKLGIKHPIIVLHIGSKTEGKEESIKRFINTFKLLPKYLQTSIAIENDDKVYNIEDVIKVSKILNIPIILDYHHHICNNINIDITPYIKTILDSWKKTKLNPKMHFSSPLNKKKIRPHNDYINSDDFIDFLNIIRTYNKDIDIMIEAKEKDRALFSLIRELKYKTNYKFIDETTFLL